MGNEFKEVMEELYKFLREKILTNFGENLNEVAKEKLYSFDLEKNIVISNSSNTIIKYDKESDSFIISDGFLTTEFIQKAKLKSIESDVEKLKKKISDGSNKILLEELIIFSEDLKIKEKDIIKSLFTQEILKYILLDDSYSVLERVVMDGTIELFAHEIGEATGFIVSTPKKLMENLEIAIDLKKELRKNFEEVIFNRNIERTIEKIDNRKLIRKINELTDDWRVIESTQNLDEVIGSINEMVEEVSQVSMIDINGNKIIKFVDENDESYLFESIDNEKFLKIYNGIKLTKNEFEKVSKEELIEALDACKGEAPLYKIYFPNKERIELSHVSDESKFENKTISINEENGMVKEAIVTKTDEIVKEEPQEIIEEEIKETFKDKLLKGFNKEKEETLNDEEYKDISERFESNKDSLTIEELDKMNKYISEKEKETNTKVVLGQKSKNKIILSTVAVLITVAIGILVGWLLFNIK